MPVLDVPKGMQITILGSGTGVPSRTRNAAGLLVRIGPENLLFDTGPGIIRRLLEVGVTYHDIAGIFYTHFHPDHTLDLAAFLFAAKYAVSLRTKKLKIFGPDGLSEFYRHLLTLYGEVITPRDYEVALQEISEGTLQGCGYEIRAMRMQHTPQSLGYRIEAGAKSAVYSGDTDVCENITQLGKDADVLILDCSFPDEMKAPGHLTPGEAGRIARISNCKKLVLSHLYPVCDSYDIIKQAREEFDGEVVKADDLMTLNL